MIVEERLCGRLQRQDQSNFIPNVLTCYHRVHSHSFLTARVASIAAAQSQLCPPLHLSVYTKHRRLWQAQPRSRPQPQALLYRHTEEFRQAVRGLWPACSWCAAAPQLTDNRSVQVLIDHAKGDILEFLQRPQGHPTPRLEASNTLMELREGDVGNMGPPAHSSRARGRQPAPTSQWHRAREPREPRLNSAHPSNM